MGYTVYRILWVVSIIPFFTLNSCVYGYATYSANLKKNEKYAGKLSSNSYDPESVTTNPYASNIPKLYNQNEKYRGKLNSDRDDPDSVSNPYGQYGSQYSSKSINNPYGPYGGQYSSKSINNPYASNPPKLYNQNGEYRGKLSSNSYDPESVSNPYGQYGNQYSSKSINNPYGPGSTYSSETISIYDSD
jgi:hypothetical protein